MISLNKEEESEINDPSETLDNNILNNSSDMPMPEKAILKRTRLLRRQKDLPVYVKNFINPHILLNQLSDTKSVLNRYSENNTKILKKRKKKPAAIPEDYLIKEKDKQLFSLYPHLISFHPAVFKHEIEILSRWNEQLVWRQPKKEQRKPIKSVIKPLTKNSNTIYSFEFYKTEKNKRRMIDLTNNPLFQDFPHKSDKEYISSDFTTVTMDSDQNSSENDNFKDLHEPEDSSVSNKQVFSLPLIYVNTSFPNFNFVSDNSDQNKTPET